MEDGIHYSMQKTKNKWKIIGEPIINEQCNEVSHSIKCFLSPP